MNPHSTPSPTTLGSAQGHTPTLEGQAPGLPPEGQTGDFLGLFATAGLACFDEVAEAARPSMDGEDDADEPFEVVDQHVAALSEEAQEILEHKALASFRLAMTARHLIPPDEFLADGRQHRCDAEGPRGENDGSYWLSLEGIPSGGFQNWKDGLGWQNWSIEEGLVAALAPAEMEELQQRAEQARLDREVEYLAEAGEAQMKAQFIWSRTAPCTDHPYLTRKGVKANGLRMAIAGSCKGSLVIPALDSAGVIHTLQFITSEGQKFFLKGGRKKACCFPIGKPKQAIFIAEGYATAASIHEATGEAVVVAFDCGNLKPVAEVIHAEFPDFPIVVAADDDYRTKENPGLTKAKAAADAVGGRVVVPDFGEDRPEGATDFNDLAQVLGPDAVRECIELQLSETEPSKNPLPRIRLAGRSEHEVLTEAVGLLADQESVFIRGEQLVHISAPRAGMDRAKAPSPSILPATAAWMRLELSRLAAFFKEDSKGEEVRSLVPDWVSKLALEMGDFQKLQKLHCLAETPVVLPDGSIHHIPGFDPTTGIYYAPLGGEVSLSEAPTHDDAKTAAATLFDLVEDFPFASDTSKAAWLALLLTIPARFAIRGPVPFWMIDANGQSAGKGLLTQLTSLITLGRDPISMVGSRDPEEFRKNVLCVLMNGTRLGWLDEAESPFGGRQWNGLITATTFQDRILGASKTWSGPHYTVWVVTGNNVQLASDTPRRCVHIRLEPSEERPEERGGFKIPNIVAHTTKHREELFGYLLTILRAYHCADRPKHDLTPWGSFEEWSDFIRECVFWCTGIDCDTRKELTATADPTRGMSAVILDQLQDLFPDQKPFLASDVLRAYETRSHHGNWEYPELREALDTLNTNPRGLNAKSLGNMLKARRDRTFNNMVLKGVAGGKQGMVYRVVNVGPGLPFQAAPVQPLALFGEFGASTASGFPLFGAQTSGQVPPFPGATGASDGSGLPNPEGQTA